MFGSTGISDEIIHLPRICMEGGTVLAALTCLFNACGYSNLVRNYEEFRAHLTCPLVTVELSYNGKFVVDDSIRLAGATNNIMWQKERLLNLGIQSLPPEVDKIAWLDADILFQNANWCREAEAMLEEFPVIQLFEVAYGLDVQGNVDLTRLSWVKAVQIPFYRGLRHRGCAWAARREVVQSGLFDKAILGGADGLMLLPWCRLWHAPTLAMFDPAFLRCFYKWARPQSAIVQGKVGFLPGEIYQMYHGSRENRRYDRRQEILRRHQFDPESDIALDCNGVWRWATPKHDLHAEVSRYFFERQEDQGPVETN